MKTPQLKPFSAKALITAAFLFFAFYSFGQPPQGNHDQDQGNIKNQIWDKIKYFEGVQLGYSNPLFIGGRQATSPISWGAYPDVNQQHRYYFNNSNASNINFHSWSGVLHFDFSDPDQPKNAEEIVNWKTRMTLDHNGTFILTSGSSSTPSFSVENGQVKARKVTVTAGSIPDYVFAKDYQLMPLKEVRTFIEKNKHLPGIKSESEFIANQNQLDIGEMQMLLLQKIEELTLYILQQQSEIETLKEHNKK